VAKKERVIVEVWIGKRMERFELAQRLVSNPASHLSTAYCLAKMKASGQMDEPRPTKPRRRKVSRGN
jgi:hypothetical protein